MTGRSIHLNFIVPFVFLLSGCAAHYDAYPEVLEVRSEVGVKSYGDLIISTTENDRFDALKYLKDGVELFYSFIITNRSENQNYSINLNDIVISANTFQEKGKCQGFDQKNGQVEILPKQYTQIHCVFYLIPNEQNQLLKKDTLAEIILPLPQKQRSVNFYKFKIEDFER